MSISGILGRSNIAALSLEIVSPDEVYDGIETLLTLKFRNRGRFLPLFIIEVLLGDGRGIVKMVARRETVDISLPATFSGRGYRQVEGVTIRSIFPVNFFIRTRTVEFDQKVLVFPAPLPCRLETGPHGRGKGGEVSSVQRGFEGDISRISDYSGVEPLKAIHWKLSARQEEFKVKELSTVSREPVILDPQLLPGRTLEGRLGCAAYLVRRFVREGRPVGLKVGSRLVKPAAGTAQKRRLLSELALYDQA